MPAASSLCDTRVKALRKEHATKTDLSRRRATLDEALRVGALSRDRRPMHTLHESTPLPRAAGMPTCGGSAECGRRKPSGKGIARSSCPRLGWLLFAQYDTAVQALRAPGKEENPRAGGAKPDAQKAGQSSMSRMRE
eukprot:gene5822-21713_t